MDRRNGNRTQMVDLDGTHTYDYDALYRLTEVTYPGPETDAYTYDPVGNRLTKDTDDYTYDAADQLTDLEGVEYDYDDNGNQTGRGSDTFDYDHENRLVESVIDSVTSTSVYNGDGLRMSHTVGQTTTSYIWDVASGLPVVLQDGTNTGACPEPSRRVYGLDLISATDDASGDQTYFLYDGLGSTTDLTDDEGNVADGYTYDVFGSIRSQTGASENYWLFTGEQRDSESGLYYLRARYYDPAIGRFLSQDPVSGTIRHSQSLGRYAYVQNNAVNLTDPTGACPNGCESEFQVWSLPALPEGPCPVEPMARARCAHARLQVLSQRITVLRQLMEWLLLEALEARAEIMHRFELCAEAGYMVGAGMVAAGAGVMVNQPMIVYVGATYIVTGYLIYHYYCQAASR